MNGKPGEMMLFYSMIPKSVFVIVAFGAANVVILLLGKKPLILELEIHGTVIFGCFN